MLKLKVFTIALVLFIAFDFLWLGFVVKEFNLRQLAEIGRIENGVFQIQYFAAGLTYLLMALAVSFYVMPSLTSQDSKLKTFLKGALMGLIIYGVFDMTNLAILKNYPFTFALADIAWGTFVFGVVTLFSTSNIHLQREAK